MHLGEGGEALPTLNGSDTMNDETFSILEWIVNELAHADRRTLLALCAAAQHEAGATVGNDAKEAALQAFSDAAQQAHDEALGR